MRVLVVLSLGLLLFGCGGDLPPPVEAARTVVTTSLVESSLQPPFEVTGVAEPYREADVSFEVSGRVTRILDVGRNVKVTTLEKSLQRLAEERKAAVRGESGPSKKEIDPFFREGDVIAEIDKTTYQQGLDAANLRLETAEASLKGMVIDAEQVAPAAVKRANAQRAAALSDVEATRAMISSFQSSKDKAERDLERNTSLLRDKQISRAEFDQYQTALDQALANLARSKAALQTAVQQAAGLEAAVVEAEASVRLKTENVGRGMAELAELRVAVAQAQTDLDRCTLRAPFAGRITRVLVSNGDYVRAGSPVLTLTLIDPIKIACTVSAGNEREIKPGHYARVMPERLLLFGDKEKFGEHKALNGTVFEKGAVADPTTRTFRIDVMVRNARRLLGKRNPDAAEIEFRELLPAVERYFGEGGPLFVCKNCCHKTADGRHFVYRIKGAKWGAPRDENLFADALDLERLEVEQVGTEPEDFMQILNWSFRRVKSADTGAALENGDLLISFERLRPEDIARGIVLSRYDWAIRPGDMVPVWFTGKKLPNGFWVPDDVIRAQNDTRAVFAVENGKARSIEVTVHESSGRLHRITGAGLKDGMKLVVRGVHYVFDGTKVFVSSEIDLKTYLGQGQ